MGHEGDGLTQHAQRKQRIPDRTAAVERKERFGTYEEPVKAPRVAGKRTRKKKA